MATRVNGSRAAAAANGYDSDEAPHKPVTKGVVSGGGLGKPLPSAFQVSDTMTVSEALEKFERQYCAGQPKSLSGIGMRAFCIGQVFSLCAISGAYMAYNANEFWRIPAFVASLSVFHFMEFWTTARYNTRTADTSAFLLSANGNAYRIAHLSAIVECFVTNYVRRHTSYSMSLTSLLPAPYNALPFGQAGLWLGIVLVVVGQVIRSLAMVQAGQSFNHIVQHSKQESHKLINKGIYKVFRHPSYFGFFWWGVGTQLVLGNTVCLAGFSYVLWLFFAVRIEGEFILRCLCLRVKHELFFVVGADKRKGEEKLLIQFFGKEYEDYRRSVKVWIPFI